MLELNQEKTELIVLSPKCQQKMALQLKVDARTIETVPAIKNLGIYFNSSLNVEKQVNAIV
ncbi:hypothetical protein KP79_PYT25808 [Mizuhopecten yessoensis]|uniref:Uncharacterized protein n=1 Tax=Mizuhopecten yessoensis TaxID=6573 RepID=A0A210PKM8_MIZYE|nr:hypothetical protein KP79_PYT25808 [Mizuhopecten yessoensis]